jgi:hypothetical protein
VVGVRDERNNEVVLGQFCVKGGGVGYVEGDWVGVFDSFAELLRALERAAGFRSVRRLFFSRSPLGNVGYNAPTVTCTPASLRTSTVGLVTGRNRMNAVSNCLTVAKSWLRVYQKSTNRIRSRDYMR